MNRRQAIRQSVLTSFAIALGKYDALAQDGGQLTVDLNQWGSVVFQYRGESVRIPMKDVFKALKYPSPPFTGVEIK